MPADGEPRKRVDPEVPGATTGAEGAALRLRHRLRDDAADADMQRGIGHGTFRHLFLG